MTHALCVNLKPTRLQKRNPYINSIQCMGRVGGLDSVLAISTTYMHTMYTEKVHNTCRYEFPCLQPFRKIPLENFQAQHILTSQN